MGCYVIILRMLLLSFILWCYGFRIDYLDYCVGIYAKEIWFASCIILRRIGNVRKFIIKLLVDT